MTDRLFGSVRFELWGDFPEDFLTLAAAEGVELWDIKRNGDVFSAKTRPWQTGDVREIAKKCRLVYTEISQSGLSHTVKKYRFRYGILAGALLLFAFVFISSRFLWKNRNNGLRKHRHKKIRGKTCGIRSKGRRAVAPRGHKRPAALAFAGFSRRCVCRGEY